MKSIDTRKIDELGRLVIPKELRNLLGLEVGDMLDIFFSTDNNTLALKRSEANDAMCNACKMEEHSLRFKSLHLCGKCTEGIASLTLG